MGTDRTDERRATRHASKAELRRAMLSIRRRDPALYDALLVVMTRAVDNSST